MSAYLIIQGTVEDWDKFKAYTTVVPPLVQKFGGKYLAMGKPELLEGDFDPKSTVISQWPDKQAVHDFWHSPEYTRAKTLRENAGVFNVMLVDGLPASNKE
ncbi:hypothetical protein BAE46_13265 [Glaciecola punicea]|jgi:uncharacterized protein (DUF1330 family)|uniref:DUF1330 domain-containing protein n=1 Tax=Glaciecola punicea TaxID=56804 RepID=UPI0008720AE8|nr:DUF1330 domain-containing protein [Glaciecola punicea]OFA29852.1 hypothetical protein BAE46_13265 [Glaciecola punicea]